MKRKHVIAFVVLTVFILTSCSFLPHSNYLPSGTAKALTALAPEISVVGTTTTLPSAIFTPATVPALTEVAPTTAPIELQTPPAIVYPPDISPANYLDDRSTAAALILSYYNAINKQEYLRAYSYWGDPANTLGSFEVFTDGYRDTDEVQVVIGQVSSEGAAGSSYSTVPVILNVTTSDQIQHKYAACYIARLTQPGNYGAPPISPMNIFNGTAKAISLGTSDADALASACSGPDYPTGGNPSLPGMESLTDLTYANYIDNRSGALELISSYFNALNRQELVRAYSYWKNPVTYADFEAEYTDWGQATALTFGETSEDAGAGQMYFQTPVVITRQLMDSTTQLVSACFVMHLSQPTFQASPPFDPLGITSLTYTSDASSADPLILLVSACP